MRILVDTHILLWSVYSSARLTAGAKRMLEDPDNDILVSTASIWEIAVKRSLGRDDFTAEPLPTLASALRMGFRELPIHSAAAARVRSFPWHHRDPFDRLLVAQAMDEPARLITVHRELARYSDLVDVVGPT